MAERDRRDSERAAAPLKAAPDAWLLDTSDMDADAAFAAALAFIERKGFRSSGPQIAAGGSKTFSGDCERACRPGVGVLNRQWIRRT
jgi:hypothetical protein